MFELAKKYNFYDRLSRKQVYQRQQFFSTSQITTFHRISSIPKKLNLIKFWFFNVLI